MASPFSKVPFEKLKNQGIFHLTSGRGGKTILGDGIE
jgi:hypothetical protein